MTALAASNHRIRRLRRLSGRRSAREDDRAFVVEGPVLVAEALNSGSEVEGVYLDESDRGSVELTEVEEAASRRAVPVHRVAPGVLAGITDSVNPRPVMAVAALPDHDVATVIDHSAQRRLPLVVLVDVRDPGNVGTIIRASDAAGVVGVLCTVGTADPWSPKVVRSSAGAVLHLPVVSGLDTGALLRQLASRGVASLATVVDGPSPYDEMPLDGALALVLGNEASGLPDDLVAAIDHTVTIPMTGQAESLNVAMAASVLLFEAARQRRRVAESAQHRTDWTPGSTDDKVNMP